MRWAFLWRSAFLLLPVFAPSPAHATGTDEPRRTGRTESVEVKLVTIGVLVMDRDGRTVNDLGREDFLARSDRIGASSLCWCSEPIVPIPW